MTLAYGHAFLKANAMPNRRPTEKQYQQPSVFNVLSTRLRTAIIGTAVSTHAKAIQSAWRA
jgi:hypothetical protein